MGNWGISVWLFSCDWRWVAWLRKERYSFPKIPKRNTLIQITYTLVFNVPKKFRTLIFYRRLCSIDQTSIAAPFVLRMRMPLHFLVPATLNGKDVPNCMSKGQLPTHLVVICPLRGSCEVYIYANILRTQLTSIFEGQPFKTRPFSIKTRVIWVLGIHTFLQSLSVGSCTFTRTPGNSL